MPVGESTGLGGFLEAVEAARAATAAADSASDSGEAGTALAETEGTTAATDQASLGTPTEQPDDKAEATGVFGDVQAAIREAQTVDPFAASVEVTVDGAAETLTVGALRDGYLRQADYTRKTQALATERASFDSESAAASKLMNALRDDPAGTVAALAIDLGLIDPTAISADKVANLNEVYSVPNREEVDAQVEARAAELVSAAPEVVAARQQVEIAAIAQEFTELEGSFDVTLTPDDRTLMMEHAVALGITDLRLTFLDLQQRASEARKATAGAAPQRPSGGSGSETAGETAPTGHATTFAESVERARKAQASQT